MHFFCCFFIWILIIEFGESIAAAKGTVDSPTRICQNDKRVTDVASHMADV